MDEDEGVVLIFFPPPLHSHWNCLIGVACLYLLSFASSLTWLGWASLFYNTHLSSPFSIHILLLHIIFSSNNLSATCQHPPL